jgi:hypothetical protein
VNRTTALLLTIPLVLPLAAGATPKRQFAFGVHGGTPTLTGNFMKTGETQEVFDTKFDLDKDFGLKADGMGTGLFVSYMGPRFGLQLDYMVSNFAGDQAIGEVLEFAGHKFNANGNIVSSLNTSIIDFDWTIKVWRPYGAWLGIDLGVQAWNIDAEASGMVWVDLPPPIGRQEERQAYKLDPIFAPIPQVGLSGGFAAFDNMLEGRARVMYVSFNGASYTRYNLDGRFYPLPWLGVRAFFDSQSLDAPLDSIIKEIEIGLDRSVFGFGVAARF